MSRVIQVWIDDATERRLQAAAHRTGRSIEDLAESAVSEEALKSERREGPGRGALSDDEVDEWHL